MHLTVVRESIRIEVPAPSTSDERSSARSMGRTINPANKDPRTWDDRLELEPDSRLIDPILALSRALWEGDPVTVEFPAPTNDSERQALTELAADLDPDNNLDLQDTGVGAALADLTYHIRATLRETTPNAARCHAVLENALFSLYAMCNVDRSDDKPMMWLYEPALMDGNVKRGDIVAIREKFRRAVKDAEKAMDIADREIARMED